MTSPCCVRPRRRSKFPLRQVYPQRLWPFWKSSIFRRFFNNLSSTFFNFLEIFATFLSLFFPLVLPLLLFFLSIKWWFYNAQCNRNFQLWQKRKLFFFVNSLVFVLDEKVQIQIENRRNNSLKFTDLQRISFCTDRIFREISAKIHLLLLVFLLRTGFFSLFHGSFVFVHNHCGFWLRFFGLKILEFIQIFGKFLKDQF